MSTEPLGASSQTVQVYERLCSDILTLELAPGQKLTERGIEAAYSASRTPVRAALNRLEADGLAERTGRGWNVTPIDLAEISEIAEQREAIESAAVRLSIVRASDDAISAFRERSEPGRGGADAASIVRAGEDFHVELARLSGNRFMAETIRSAMTRLARTRFLEVRTEEARAQAIAEHRAIADALGHRDGDRAADLLAAHIHGTNERLLASLGADRQRLRAHGVRIADVRS